jgi:hypothetical protein
MDAHDSHELNVVADAVVIDLVANAIRIRVPGFPAGTGDAVSATLDVGSNGRLIGLEVGERYVSVMDLPGTDDPYVRSAEILVEISSDTPPSIAIPRRGSGYEITYPSGNECWQTKSVNGQLIQVCATIDAAPGALNDARERRGIEPLRHPGTAPGSRGPH